MLIELLAREAAPEERQEGRDGEPVRRGTPLRTLLDEMRTNAGWVNVHLQAVTESEPATSELGRRLRLLRVTHADVVIRRSRYRTAPYRLLDEHTVQVDLSAWSSRDPDSTYLVLGWRLVPPGHQEEASTPRREPATGGPRRRPAPR